MQDLISRQAAIDAIAQCTNCGNEDTLRAYVLKHSLDNGWCGGILDALDAVKDLPSAQPDIIYCKDCKHWRQQTNYQGAPLSFGFCESDDMWRSLYGETTEVSHIDTDDDFFCGYAERKTDE